MKRLPIEYTFTAREDLEQIWNRNAKKYTRQQASEYIAFLEKRIEVLSTKYEKGRQIVQRSNHRYIVVKKPTKAHGHIVVYTFDVKKVSKLHLCHTAQDWLNHLD